MQVEMADFDRVYQVNLRGALLVSQAILPHMIERKYGRLLHVASIAGKEGNAGMTAYSATKAGLIGMVKSLAKDYVETGHHHQRAGAGRDPHRDGGCAAAGDRGLHDRRRYR